MNNKKIHVTRPFLPPLKEFYPYLEKIWENNWLTNQGPFHQQFEKELAKYLNVKHISLFANGTLALVTALQTLRLTGEIITTPFSFVATSHALLWNNITPVFVDIEADSYNIDPLQIVQAITPKTTAILAVHVYGRPCNIEEIQKIADIYGLKVIFDAAHAFAVSCNKRSVLDFGDLSILSLHATKVFNTFEGGAIISPNVTVKKRIDYLKNFGFADEVTVMAPGINGKMNELQASFGLLQLQYIDGVIIERKNIDAYYRKKLQIVPGIKVLPIIETCENNYSYFPILVDVSYHLSRDALYHKFREANIFVRRYFYPLICEFPMYNNLPSSNKNNLPVAYDIASKILCLPIYPGLSKEDSARIINIIIDN